jgi:hypothetical protein
MCAELFGDATLGKSLWHPLFAADGTLIVLLLDDQADLSAAMVAVILL